MPETLAFLYYKEEQRKGFFFHFARETNFKLLIFFFLCFDSETQNGPERYFTFKASKVSDSFSTKKNVLNFPLLPGLLMLISLLIIYLLICLFTLVWATIFC